MINYKLKNYESLYLAIHKPTITQDKNLLNISLDSILIVIDLTSKTFKLGEYAE